MPAPPPSDAEAGLGDLLLAAAAAYERHGSGMSGALAEWLRRNASRPAGEPPHEVAACQALEGIMSGADPGGAPLLAAVARVRDRLTWRTPGAGRVPEPLASGLAACEVIGPMGMIEAETFRFGLFLQLPGLDYPGHQHEAEELYLVLSGGARWSRDGVAPEEVPPGGFIHHAPWQVHATATQAEPLLAFWAWGGNVSLDTYRMAGREPQA